MRTFVLSYAFFLKEYLVDSIIKIYEILLQKANHSADTFSVHPQKCCDLACFVVFSLVKNCKENFQRSRPIDRYREMLAAEI